MGNVIAEVATIVALGVVGIMAGRLPKPIPVPRPGWWSVLLGLVGAILGGAGFALLVFGQMPQSAAELTAALFIGFSVGYLVSDFGTLGKK